MLKRMAPMTDGFDPVPTLLGHLDTGNEVIRTDAIRALAHVTPGDDRVRLALLSSLRDADPDVRTDAMDALRYFAQPEDAKDIRASLAGDPVREVKLAAIDVLCQLRDKGAIPLLQKLVTSRAEEDVAWEDDIGLWDEWLEVQAAAIRTLGALGAVDAIEDILAARDDEFGQNLDLPVCDALSDMGETGMVWLLAIAQTEGKLQRKRALEALRNCDAEALRPHVDFILSDPMAEVRALALPHLPAADERLVDLARTDLAAEIRVAALSQCATLRPDLPPLCLSDADPTVQASALDHLAVPLDPKLADALLPNMQAWLLTDEGTLAKAVARNWLRLAGPEQLNPLMMLIRNADRPLEARLAAVDAVAQAQDEGATERLISLLGNPAQQIRTLTLTHLVTRAEQGDAAATDALSAAIEGVILAPASPEAAAPAEEVDTPSLRIAEDGQVETTKTSTPGRSTLEAIQISRVASSDLGRGEKRKGKKAQKRRNIEGPTDTAHDLSRVALGLVGRLPEPQIGTAIRTMTENTRDDLRIAAYQALSKRAASGLLADDDLPRISNGLMDRTAAVRTLAIRMAVDLPAFQDDVLVLLADPDAMIRALAVAAVNDEKVLLACLDDADNRVRAAAMTKLIAMDTMIPMSEIVMALLRNQAIPVLRQGAEQSAEIRTAMVEHLAQPELTASEVHVLLQALSARV